jgi:hypothetical protein
MLSMLKHNKGGKIYSKYIEKRLLCFQVYGYCKGIINVSKNTNLKYSPYVTNTIYVSPFFHTWQIGVFISKIGA